MRANDLRRIVFYSKEDMSAGYNLTTAEELLKDLDEPNEEINDLLELYNVKLYFEHDLYLPSWDSVTKQDFQEKIKRAFEVTRIFMLSISDSNILVYIESLEYKFRESFWSLFSFFQIYKSITDLVFSDVLQKFPHQIGYVLENKNLVKHFDKPIRDFLMSYEKSGELLLSCFEEHRRSNSSSIYFPSSLSLSDKERIISQYIDGEEANLNFVRLVVHSNSPELKLSDKIKLKAKKRADVISDKFFTKENSIKTGVQISMSESQIEPEEVSVEEYILEVSYSKKYFDEQLTDIDLFHCFVFPFAYVDEQGLITLVSKQSEMGVLERMMMKSKNEYPDGMMFRQKSHTSYAQLLMFDHYLSSQSNSLERLIESYVKDYLNLYSDIKNLRFVLPTPSSSYYEKIRVLAPEFEFILKQYQNYSDDGKIDFDLLQFSSTPLRLSEVKSVVQKKYVYSNGDALNALKYQFFSDQSSVYFVEPYGDKYDSFYELLTKENVEYDCFKNYQQPLIDHLISQGYLFLDKSGFVKIGKPIFIYIVGYLYKNEALNYWYQPLKIRDTIDEMISNGFLIYKNTLFSEQEISYFNFHLNKKEFTNGFDLRNKYLHGTNSTSDVEHQRNYFILLKLVVLALLKIGGDLSIGNKFIA